jgi:hypothetical protein
MSAREPVEQLGVSALIELLEMIRERHGDLPIVLRDADTCWTFRLTADHLALGQPHPAEGARPRLEIGADYASELDYPTRLSDLRDPLTTATTR